jgi:predicted Zn-dependent protease
VIRVVTLDAFEDADIDALCKSLYQAYGIGCEHAGSVSFPEDAESADVPGAYDAAKLLAEADAVKTFTDDKLVYVTRRRLSQPEGPLGRPPTNGFARYGGERAVLTTAGLDLPDLSEELRKRIAKQAVHEVGRLWELHTCIDPKCSMQPTWSEGFAHNVEPVLCAFCREKSENKIRMAKT